jgi:hypothetical protein
LELNVFDSMRSAPAADQFGLREREEIVVALEVGGPVAEARAAIARLREPVILDHRAHRAVEDEDPAIQEGAQRDGAIGTHGHLQTKKPVQPAGQTGFPRFSRICFTRTMDRSPEAPAS